MTFQATIRIRTMGDADYYVFDLPKPINDNIQENRIVVTLNNQLSYHTPLLPLGSGRGRYIMVNAERRRRLDLDLGDTVYVKLTLDTSPYGMPVPEEWRVLLDEDAELQALFDELNAGKQRRLLYTVSKPRTEATRVRKAVGAAEYLCRVGSGQFSYAGLLAWLRGDNH